MRLGLLVCDHVDDRFVGIDGDYPDMFAALLPWADLVPYDVVRDEHPTSPDECDGWVATGSRYSVYDAMPWLPPPPPQLALSFPSEAVRVRR